jgi:hypothetical protein
MFILSVLYNVIQYILSVYASSESLKLYIATQYRKNDGPCQCTINNVATGTTGRKKVTWEIWRAEAKWVLGTTAAALLTKDWIGEISAKRADASHWHLRAA